MPEPQTRVDVGRVAAHDRLCRDARSHQVFGFIPGVTLPAFIVAAIWMLMAMVVAVRQALDYQGHRASDSGLRDRLGAGAWRRVRRSACSSGRPCPDMIVGRHDRV